MRLQRLVISCGALAALAVACTHDDPVTTPVSQNGEDTIAIITLSAAPAGFLSGNQSVTYIASGPFDTSVADAFARATTNPPFLIPDPTGCYGSQPLIFEAGSASVPFNPPNRFLPAIVSGPATGDAGCGGPTTYIVRGGHPGNGGGNRVWEFWHYITGTTDPLRYVSGFARYAVVQRGALDISDVLLNGSVTSPDSLVLYPNTSVLGGKKSDAVFTTNCASANVIQARAGFNPYMLGGGASSGAAVQIDQTVCDTDGVWVDGSYSGNKSPIPANNNTAFSPVQYNFFVIWEALADSTPNYARPVFRVQVGPLLDATGKVVNNSYAPTPTAQLSGALLGPLPGSTSSVDSVKATFNLLKPLSSGAYQVWVTNTAGTNSGRLTGRVVRLYNGVAKDTVPNASEFNLLAGQNGARFEGALGALGAQTWNRLVLVVQPTSGATTISAQPSEPLWGKITNPKPSGAAAVLAGTLSFGSFDNGAADSTVFAAGGSGTGGFFGTQLVQTLSRLSRPPLGYQYEAWLLNSTDTSVHLNAGTLLGPAPDYVSLKDADIMTTPPLSGVEITQATFATDPGSYGAWCKIGTIAGTPPDTSINPIYDLLQIRLGPKGGNPAILSPTVALSATLGVPVGATHNKGKCTP
jgi:hypothetical protein